MGLVTTLKYEDSILQIHLYNDFDLIGNVTIQVLNADCYINQFLPYISEETFQNAFKNERIAWVTFVSVRLHYRGNGYSRILINRAIAWLFNFGIGNFALEVAPACTISKNELAKYYSTFGFDYLVETRKDLLMFLRKEK